MVINYALLLHPKFAKYYDYKFCVRKIHSLTRETAWDAQWLMQSMIANMKSIQNILCQFELIGSFIQILAAENFIGNTLLSILSAKVTAINYSYYSSILCAIQ